jgi:hypothetical protein
MRTVLLGVVGATAALQATAAYVNDPGWGGGAAAAVVVTM